MEEKKIIRVLIVLIAVLILIILGLGGYICYDKFYQKENKFVIEYCSDERIAVREYELVWYNGNRMW